jgi:hypothetical protein
MIFVGRFILGIGVTMMNKKNAVLWKKGDIRCISISMSKSVVELKLGLDSR